MFVLFGPAFSSDNSGDGPKGTRPKLENYKTYDPTQYKTWRNSMDSKLPDQISRLYNDPDYVPLYVGDEEDEEYNDLKESYETLENFGNMSSPTILFVIKNYVENNIKASHKNICALGFGPGLSIESITFEHV